MKVYQESGGSTANHEKAEKSDKQSSKKSKSKPGPSTAKAGTGSKYVSKEFIEDDDSSSDSGTEKV